MNWKSGCVLVLTVASTMAWAQDAAETGQSTGQAAVQGRSGRMGRMGMGGPGMLSGNSVMGEVTAVAPDHFVVKSYAGETYTVHYGENTRFVKAPPGGSGQWAGRGGAAGDTARPQGRSDDQMGMAPAQIKSTEIKVGANIAAMGEVDHSKREAGAMVVALMDPERADAMKQMIAGYGKTWVMGRVTGQDGVLLTIAGTLDDKQYVIQADENTTLRKRRDPVTLADIHVGDVVRAMGVAKGNGFAAASIQVMGGQQGGPGQPQP